jgi:hypothetical protein
MALSPAPAHAARIVVAAPSRSAVRSRLAWAAMLAASALLMVATGLLWFQSAGIDDNYITYGAAAALVETGSITNYSGDAVEQSSSLLHVLVIALLARASGLDVPLVGWLSALAAALLCLAAMGALHERSQRGRITPAIPWLAASGYFAYWALSGMETTLAALAGVVWVAVHAAYLRAPSSGRYAIGLLAAAALGTVRPEAPLLAFFVLAAAAVVNRATRSSEELRSTLRLLLGNVLVAAGIGAWRLLRFGTLFPQPVYAKQGPDSWQRVHEGMEYLFSSTSLGILWIGLLAGGVRLLVLAREGRRLPPAEVLAFAFCTGVLGFSVAVGGDWMEGGRFLCPAIPLACFVAAQALDLAPTRSVRTALALLMGLSLAGGGAELARSGSAGVVAWASIRGADSAAVRKRPFYERRNRVHVRDVAPMNALTEIVGRVIEAKGRRVWILTGQGGMAMYHVVDRYRGEVGVIDRRGLMDRILTSSPTVTAAGRERWGLTRRYDYLFDRIDRVRSETRMPLPDVVYDLRFDKSELRSLIEHGYEPFFEQTGEIASSSARFPGRHLSARETIFVHRRYAADLTALESTRHEF